MNRTHHIEITKQRLHETFDVILIMERPETYQVLYTYFAFLDENHNTNNHHQYHNDEAITVVPIKQFGGCREE